MKIILFLISYIFALDYKKNMNILNDKKGEVRAQHIEDLDTLKANINNAMIVFYADWCPHWYKSIT
jgi:hypothetical protein